MKKLSIVGAGRVGKTLGYLFNKLKIFQINEVLNSTLESANEVVEFIGFGRAIESIHQLNSSEIFLITTPDQFIRDVSKNLLEVGLFNEKTIVFHCSGSLESAILSQVGVEASFASIHPIKSFAKPLEAAKTFNGTYCGIEGDERALQIIEPAFQRIGAYTFRINSALKKIYHSASVFICNYLVALIEVGRLSYIKSGVDEEIVYDLMQHMIEGTLQNVLKFGTVQALTGPIARGDYNTVKDQMNELEKWDVRISELYSVLGQFTMDLAIKLDQAPDKNLRLIDEILKCKLT